MHYKTYQYNGCNNNKTIESLEKNHDAVIIIDNNMIIIINNIEMYVFLINTSYDSMFVKYTTNKTSLTNNVIPYGLELWYTDDDLLYPIHESLQLLYTKTIEILNITNKYRRYIE
jgi:hypothetical protein